jgi:hypothetical protein
MKDNTRLVNACGTHQVSLMNSSGNSGLPGVNNVVANVPVILHQVCFNLLPGEELVISEDEVTDLTTSIITVQGAAVTEHPVFEHQKVRRPKAMSHLTPETSSDLNENRNGLSPRSSDEERAIVSVSPNPADNFTVAVLSGLNMASQIRCVDAHGKTVLEKSVTEGSRQLNLDTSVWPSGTYYLIVQTEDQTSTSSFVVTH